MQQVVGYRVREARERQGWTMEQFGERMGSALGRAPWVRQQVFAAEHGDRAWAVEELVVAALVLEVPVLELIKPQPDDLVTLPSQLISAEDLRAVVLGTYRDEDAPLALLVAADEAMDAVNRARVALNVAAISMRRGRYPVTDEAEADDGKN
jgi:transcriptional regulator with XRE-family HTH domain